MPAIQFRYQQNLPTIAPGIEGVAIFDVAAWIDRAGNEVKIKAVTCAIEHMYRIECGVTTFYSIDVPKEDSFRTDEQRFLGLLREKAREYFAKKQRIKKGLSITKS